MRKKPIILLFSFLIAVILCGAASAGDNITVNKTATQTGPDTAKITITVNGPPESTTKLPADIVLALDCSGSMTGQPMTDSKAAANGLVDQLQATDQAAVVNWESVIQPSSIGLTNNFVNVHTAINGGTAGATTDMALAIQQSITYLQASTIPQNSKNIILLTDGNPDDENTALSQAQVAASLGFRIFTIGLGDNINQVLLQQIADLTNGKFYLAPTSAQLPQIYSDILNQLQSQTATNIVVTDQLPSYIQYEDNASIAPFSVVHNPDGTTTLVWNVGSLSTGETWTVTFDVKSDKAGYLPTDVTGTVDYKDPEGIDKTAILPVPYINFTKSTNPQNIAKSESVNATNTIGMQTTGAPIGMLVLAALMLLGGIIKGKK